MTRKQETCCTFSFLTDDVTSHWIERVVVNSCSSRQRIIYIDIVCVCDKCVGNIQGVEY